MKRTNDSKSDSFGSLQKEMKMHLIPSRGRQWKRMDLSTISKKE